MIPYIINSESGTPSDFKVISYVPGEPQVNPLGQLYTPLPSAEQRRSISSTFSQV